MPDIDLKTHEYERKDPRTGKMVRDFSPRYMRNMTIGCVLILVFIFWHKDEVTTGILFGVTAMFSAGAGIFAANWLKDIY